MRAFASTTALALLLACTDPTAGNAKTGTADASSGTGKPAAYKCTGKPGEDGTPCDDGSACTFDDRCVNGQCIGSKVGLVYGGDKVDEGRAVIALPDGFALAGRTGSKGAGGFDLWLVRTDLNGNLLWDAVFGGAGEDQANALVRTPDGGFAIAGATGAKVNAQGAEESGDMALVKADNNGKLVWQKALGGTGTEVAYGLALAPGGGFALAGFVRSAAADHDDADLLATDGNGKLQWDQTFGGPKDDRAQALLALTDGYALAGFTASKGAGEKDGWLVRTDANGKKVWEQTYGSAMNDAVNALAKTADGGFVLAGYTQRDVKKKSDLWLVRTDATGKQLWEHVKGGPELDGAQAVIVLNDGTFVAAGDTGATQQSSVTWLYQLDKTGNFKQEFTYGKADVGQYVTNAVAPLADGGFALAGTILWDLQKRHDMWLVRTDANGKSTCE
jgi:hypothetical protein